ncbi:MAG: CAP domain-containing protein [Chloroflexaceae bacterium]|nr:CAP domain-containing protein [Chloroflexaceae bacterium]NJO08016.1 CAP domain-containing protein [Chloroflexaceae bacterium]
MDPSLELGIQNLTPPAEDDLGDQALALINERRTEQGCPPLTRNNQLDTAAYAHSEDMALNDYFAHESRDGSPFWMRIQAAGYNFALAAENLVAGTADPAVAVATWMSSDAHRVNILNCDLTETGLGFYTLDGDTGNINYTYYWTQVFATPQ